MPMTSIHLKEEEDKVFAHSKMRTLDLTSIPQPESAQGIGMIAPDQKLSCFTYDFFDVIQDLLNDGEHSRNAHFTFEPEPSGTNNDNVVGEMWTAGWWQQQQEVVGAYEKILAVIVYVDETNVTFNGRNVHPVYISLGNLHVEYRCAQSIIIYVKNIW